MAKRRSKIKLGGRTPLRDTRSRGPSKRPVLSRKLTRQLDLNSVKSCGETCSEGSIHEDEVKSPDVINTETATAELRDEQSSENGMSSEEDRDKPTKMKKSPVKRSVQSEKTLSTCPREIDGEQCLDIECGNNKAVLYLSKLCVGSKGACIVHDGTWLTPNGFQFISGRETAKDWKRSIRHNGYSLKVLITNGFVELHTTPPTPQTPATNNNNNNNNNNNSSSNNSSKAEKLPKQEKKASSPEPADNKRRYVPVKRRNGIVKDKVGGKRKKIKRSKKGFSNRSVAKPQQEVTEAESPDVTDGNKENVATTPCPSKVQDQDVDDVKKSQPEAESDDQGSEEFFKTLKLSKTPSNSTSPSPISEEVPDGFHSAVAVHVDQTEAVAKENEVEVNNDVIEENVLKTEEGDDANPKVVETFRSRLIADDTRLRISINRQVVCMKEDDVKPEGDATVVEEVKNEEPETEKETSERKLVEPVTSFVEQKTEMCNVKTETVTKEDNAIAEDSENDSLEHIIDDQVVKVDTVDDVDIVDTLDKVDAEIRYESEEKCAVIEKEIPITTSAILPSETVTDTDVKNVNEPTDVLKQTTIDCKCDDIAETLQSKSAISVTDIISKTCAKTFTAPSTSSTILSYPSALLQKSCYKHATTMVPCDCPINGVKDKQIDKHIDTKMDTQIKEAKAHKPVTTEAVKCNKTKAHESPRSMATTKTISESSSFQEKTQYENDMLELMSIYRPVMLPCDGRCPYVCPDTTGLRTLGDATSPYTACQNNKWPATSPFLPGVMTPEMMYYMTQQLYFDMYSSSLYGQCTSTSDKDKHNKPESQPKPVKRKAPEHDPDLPLDLTVKRAKLDNDKPKSSHTHTQDSNSPIDFSKKPGYSFETKVSHASKFPFATQNGLLKSNGYRAKQSSQHSGSNMCTCGKKEDIRTWNVDKVCSFLKQYHDCAVYTKTFRDQGIDGRLLPYLTMQHLTRTLGMQKGPAITFLDAVDQQLRGSAARYCQWCKG